LKVSRLAALLLLALGCGPVVAPEDEQDAGPPADAGAPDLCARPDAPEFCADAGPPPPPSTCSAGRPDGRCTPLLEDCSCEDCSPTARCRLQCINDDQCDPLIGEDCSCQDCDGKVEACAPPSVGCKDNGVCSPLEDDCTCADCRQEPACLRCTTNGYCAAYLEGCGCADCEKTPACAPL
jgi:hypothetical protein